MTKIIFCKTWPFLNFSANLFSKELENEDVKSLIILLYYIKNFAAMY
jgi:hypothetical protein